MCQYFGHEVAPVSVRAGGPCRAWWETVGSTEVGTQTFVISPNLRGKRASTSVLQRSGWNNRSELGGIRGSGDGESGPEGTQDTPDKAIESPEPESREAERSTAAHAPRPRKRAGLRQPSRRPDRPGECLSVVANTRRSCVTRSNPGKRRSDRQVARRAQGGLSTRMRRRGHAR